MLTLHLSSLIKFLIGIVFLQGSTGLLVYTALRTDLTQTWPLFGALGVTLAAMTALWFNAIADGSRKEALAKVREADAVGGLQRGAHGARDAQRLF